MKRLFILYKFVDIHRKKKYTQIDIYIITLNRIQRDNWEYFNYYENIGMLWIQSYKILGYYNLYSYCTSHLCV